VEDSPHNQLKTTAFMKENDTM